MDVLEYKGFRGAVRFSVEDRVLHGRILAIDDVATFEGANVDDLESAFRQAVDDYIATCEKLGRKPARSYSGRIPLRIDPTLHRRVAIAADTDAKSVNRWIADALASATSDLDDSDDKPSKSAPPRKNARSRPRRRKRTSPSCR
jgi:predicted HicB family RNase H-like nuclease